ncbi:MAG: tyrosine-type recombinase/integrase [Planctomycetota bacterium]
MRAWIYQDSKQVKKKGADDASWFVGWYDPEGKQRCRSCGSGEKGQRNAEKLQRRIEGELAAGTYQMNVRKTWKEFRTEFDTKVLPGKRITTQRAYMYCLDNFERIIKPVRLQAITTKTVNDFVAARRTEPGMRKGTLVGKATINKELRHLRAALRKAHDLGYLSKVPKFSFEKEPKKLPSYMSDAHFLAIYAQCEVAKHPSDLPNGVTACAWWQGLLTTAFMTGWRISSLMALTWDDVDLEAGTALSAAADNKGDRDQFIPLHPIVIEHLKALKVAFTKQVFPWSLARAMLWKQFQRLQKAANVKPTKKEWYGFHDVRRGFATYNADRMTADALQALMGHKDYSTTQRYINMARQLNPTVANLFVPTLPKKEQGQAPDERKA